MTSTTARVTIREIQDTSDHDEPGTCGECGRQGLRWVAILSTGAAVGLECAKPILGYKPQPKSYNWLADFTAVARYQEGDALHILYQHRTGTATRSTTNGSTTLVGGARAAWTQRGWL